MNTEEHRDSPRWDRFRQQMPVSQRWAYFDHAAVAPLSAAACEAVSDWASDATHNGDVNWPSAARRVEAVRPLAAELMGAQAEEIALVHSTTDGLGLVAEGLDWKAGDNVIAFEGEFPSNLFPWMKLESRGVETRIVATSPTGAVDPRQVEDACDERTRLIAISWVGYASGWRCDPRAMAQLAHRRGAFLCLDAIQGLGVFPLNVQEAGIDFLAADGHKWLLGPEGAGLLYVRREHLDRLRPLGVGWNSVVQAGEFTDPTFTLKPTAARYEGGSHNLLGLLGLGASLKMLSDYPTADIAARVLHVGDGICERVEALGGTVFSDRRAEHASGIVAFEFSGCDLQKLRAYCIREGIILSYRGGRLRASPHAYQNEEDLDRLSAALEAGIRHKTVRGAGESP
jgi:selenocysteine lyase/cysteine desulfurase